MGPAQRGQLVASVRSAKIRSGGAEERAVTSYACTAMRSAVSPGLDPTRAVPRRGPIGESSAVPVVQRRRVGAVPPGWTLAGDGHHGRRGVGSRGDRARRRGGTGGGRTRAPIRRLGDGVEV